ncbi:HAMP domain-containing histidine kinase [Paraneptunicella aestuarii]|uniref:sensor histidine kinase n=1 Tax=Paraneptunicella aestuarii TaxID=2831148 RepID=UPI001E65AB54|nr:HAMP domain-containing sensor histidine kinase [Paraneptunicella aestuarii]UAA39424.1 HAMP domain-containing histidine kinase [Paraneptunicella aestuarii]
MLNNIQFSGSHEVNSQGLLQEIAHGLSHDFGACLRAVRCFAELIKKHHGNNISEDEQIWFNLIQENSEKMDSMIKALVHYLRLQHESEPVTEFNFSDLVDTIVHQQILKHESGARSNHNIPDITIKDLPKTISARKNQMSILISSLLDNALKYQPQKKSHTPRITIDCNAITSGYVLTTSDNGIGVHAKQLPLLTRPFTRGVDERDYPGLGMGLSYCALVAMQHKAKLKLHSDVNKGFSASFEFLQPVN